MPIRREALSNQSIQSIILITGNHTPEYVVSHWALEKQHYTFSNNSCSSRCGHYTQVGPK